jgi:tripartite-type tricarboxylate transporter receptor subunit TctC
LKVQFADHYKAGRLKLILQLARKKSPELPNVRHIYDYAKTKEDRQLLDIVFARQEIGRAVAGPPGLPANKAKALRAAFMATVKDPQFLSESKKQSLIITPSTGQHVEALIRKFSSYPKPVIAKAAKVMKGGKKRKKKGGKKKKKS